MIPEYDNLVPYFNAICDPNCYKRKTPSHCPYWDVCEMDLTGETIEERTIEFESAMLKRYHKLHG